MPYEYSRDSGEIIKRLNRWAITSAPGQAIDRIEDAIVNGTQADTLVNAREPLYAHYDLLDEEGRNLLGNLAQYAVESNWSGENAEGRCEKILALVKGEIEPEDAPAPKTNLREDGADWRGPQAAPAGPEPIVPAPPPAEPEA